MYQASVLGLYPAYAPLPIGAFLCLKSGDSDLLRVKTFTFHAQYLKHAYPFQDKCGFSHALGGNVQRACRGR